MLKKEMRKYMRSLVYIDACMRKESRTRRIAKPIISKLS